LYIGKWPSAVLWMALFGDDDYLRCMYRLLELLAHLILTALVPL